MSVYLWHSEGATPRNRAILEQAGLKAKSLQWPWMLAGDFNVTPDELEEDAGDWLRKIGGVVVKSDSPTCRSASGGRIIDYCVIDARMAGAVVAVSADQDFPLAPIIPSG